MTMGREGIVDGFVAVDCIRQTKPALMGMVNAIRHHCEP
jgi:hypothetical protein